MASCPISHDPEQLPLERFLAEGATEQSSIFDLDGAGIVSTHDLCTCKTIGLELEVVDGSEGEYGASKIGRLVMEYNSVGILVREA